MKSTGSQSPPENLSFFEACQYVGTNHESGEVQLLLLKLCGCKSNSSVLEIGCGCLNASIPIIEYLNPNKYVGIDPNEWLRNIAFLENPKFADLAKSKSAVFLSRDDFDATGTGRTFDYVFSHSILSHCAQWQLVQFVSNCKKVLSKNGKIVASIRIGEDSMCEEWQYPHASYFSFETVEFAAKNNGLSVSLRPEFTKILTAVRPQEFHDWVIFSAK